MRATVALVETRPETVREDFARVLKLAGFARPEPLASRLVLGTGPGGAWFPGAAATPWQVAAACEHFAADASPLVFAMDEQGRPAAGPEPALAAALTPAGAIWAGNHEWARRPVRPAADLPRLLEWTGGSLTVPAGLAGQPVVLLPTPAVGGGWPLAGAVALLAALLAPGRRSDWRGRRAELLVEIVRFARASLHVTGAVLDGTMWSVADGVGRRETLQGNVLVAGRDPVAVDAVACRLAGGDPRRVPWLRACTAEGLGSGDPRDIRLVGRTELVELGLGLPPRVLMPTIRLAAQRSLRAAAWRLLKRPAAVRRHRESAWGRLRHESPEPKD